MSVVSFVYPAKKFDVMIIRNKVCKDLKESANTLVLFRRRSYDNLNVIIIQVTR